MNDARAICEKPEFWRRLFRNLIFSELGGYQADKGLEIEWFPLDPSELTLDMVADLLIEMGAQMDCTVSNAGPVPSREEYMKAFMERDSE